MLPAAPHICHMLDKPDMAYSWRMVHFILFTPPPFETGVCDRLAARCGIRAASRDRDPCPPFSDVPPTAPRSRLRVRPADRLSLPPAKPVRAASSCLTRRPSLRGRGDTPRRGLAREPARKGSDCTTPSFGGAARSGGGHRLCIPTTSQHENESSHGSTIQNTV